MRTCLVILFAFSIAGCGSAIGAQEQGGSQKSANGTTAVSAKRELSNEDRQLIEKLMDALKARNDLKIVRKDKIFDARKAAWYMKYKWDQHKDEVRSVEDFIALQSVGGEKGEITYYVQFSDGSRRPAREVLQEEVDKLRGKSQASAK